MTYDIKEPEDREDAYSFKSLHREDECEDFLDKIMGVEK